MFPRQLETADSLEHKIQNQNSYHHFQIFFLPFMINLFLVIHKIVESDLDLVHIYVYVCIKLSGLITHDLFFKVIIIRGHFSKFKMHLLNNEIIVLIAPFCCCCFFNLCRCRLRYASSSALWLIGLVDRPISFINCYKLHLRNSTDIRLT